jgi:hypothetical protein
VVFFPWGAIMQNKRYVSEPTTKAATFAVEGHTQEHSQLLMLLQSSSSAIVIHVVAVCCGKASLGEVTSPTHSAGFGKKESDEDSLL